MRQSPTDGVLAMTLGSALPRGWIETTRGALLRLYARVVANDPGRLALRRGARGVLSFALTVAMASGVSAWTGQSVMSMTLGFSVSVFGAVIAREAELRARLGSTLGLFVSAGAFFCISALIAHPWLNHLLFVGLIFVVVYARRWGERANAIGFGAYTSFFLASFLEPPPAALPWHLLGLVLAALAVLIVQLLLVPQRPARSFWRVRTGLTRRLDALLEAIDRHCAESGQSDSARRQLGRELAFFHATIGTARTQLDAITVGWQARNDISFALFELETATEQLARAARAIAAGACEPGDRERLAALRAELRGEAPSRAEAAPVTALAVALNALRDSHRGLLEVRVEQQGGPAPGGGADAPAAPAGPRLGLQTRLAIQASTACALAIVAGEWLSPQRWYWATITVFVMFSGTTSRGDALYKSLQRLLGTVLGVLAALALISWVGAERELLFGLMLVAIFATYYFFTEHFFSMTFSLTVMIALLFAVVGRFSEQLLWLRLEETAIGAVAGTLVAAVLFPRTTHGHVWDTFLDFMDALGEFVDAWIDRLEQPDDGGPIGAQTRKVERADEAVRAALRPWRLATVDGGARLHDAVLEELRACTRWLHALTLAAPPAGGAVDDAVKRALEEQRQHFDARLRQLRDDARASAVLDPRQPDSSTRGWPARAVASEASHPQIEVATQALQNLAAALTRATNALRGVHRGAPLLRF
jgi:fusaric acid resistance family protein